MRDIPKRYIRPIPLPGGAEKTLADLGKYDRTLYRRRLNVPSGLADGPWDGLGNALLMAGGMYPLILWAIVVVFSAAAFLIQLLTGRAVATPEVILFLPFSLVVALFSGVVCLVYTGGVTIFALLFVAAVTRLLGWSPHWERLGAFCGGFVAFVCFLPFTYGEVIDFDSLPSLWLGYALGPGLAIMWGMFAGAHAGIRNHRRSVRGEGAGGHRLKFSIKQMMIVTLVVSLLMALLRLAQLLNSSLLFAVGFWLMCQLAFHIPVTRLARWLYLRRARKYLRYRARWRALSNDAVPLRHAGKLAEAAVNPGR